MNKHLSRCPWKLIGLSVLLAGMLATESEAQDWSALRGAGGLGVANPQGILQQTSEVELKVRWKRKIGSGYSSVVVQRDRLLVMYSLGPDDVIECLHTQDGRSIWRERIDAKFVGENGSFDGPLSTPVIHQGKVFGLTPRGKLFCRALVDGQEIWSRDLVAEDQAVKPEYGFATSPMVAGGNLIVQVGAKDKAVAAYGLDDGQLRWATGNDEINSQSPARVFIAGQEIILAAGGKRLMGVDPIDGNVRFDFEHHGGNGGAIVPVVLDDSTVLLTLDDNYSKAFQLTESDGQISTPEAWTAPAIKNTYNVPVLANQHVFAYSTRFLTCVDPATGLAKWKNREPGDGFLIAIDGKLIITTKSGSLHVAETSAASYREIAELSLFDDLVWSIPAYDDNAIFQRSLGEVACVEIVPRNAAAAIHAGAKVVVGAHFAAMLDEVNAAPDGAEKQKLVDRYLADQSSIPIVEENVVHFIYRGSAADVAVAGDIFGSRQERTMLKVPGTDLSYYALQLPSDQRANYLLLVDYQPQLDPLNPRRALSSLYAGEMEFAVRLQPEKPLEMNWFAMNEWHMPAWRAQLSDAPSATLESNRFTSEISKSELAFDVYLPPSYSSESDRRSPVIYVMDGPGARLFGMLPEIANSVFSEPDRVAPILVFVDAMAGNPMGGQSFSEILAKEIVPLVDSKYATQADRLSRSLWGTGFSAGAAIDVLGKHSEIFSAASVQSPLLFGDATADASRLIAQIKEPTRIYLEWGRFDMFNPHENWDLRTMSQDALDRFQGNPQVQITGGAVNDSTDWSSWQNRFEQIVDFLTER